MKNWLIIMTFGFLIAALMSCNQKEQVTTLEENTLSDHTTTDQIIQAIEETDGLVTIRTNDSESKDDSEASDVREQLYCLYMVLSAEGADCPEEWKRFYKFCANCPSTKRCPGHHSEETEYELVNEEGKVICKGKMRRQIVLPNLNDCDDCPEDEGFKKGYEFVE